ncbi:MAG TPA: DUF2461 domain-containing protein [Terriglobales bacterium]|jgi:uncharacterized protein (TIGR02453 family)|nr:DUF2461 domain-containing protein [Terriglobales bacterium]
MSEVYFTDELFGFLKQLRRHNKREWFQANKSRYEEVVRNPCLRFIADVAAPLQGVSPWLVADPHPTRGSLFRIYRDTRFSPDKRPYKTHVGMSFPHRGTKQKVHLPGFYLHLEPEGCFAAAGCWHPDNPTVTRIRSAIVARPEAWKKAVRNLELEGDSLSRPPRGYPCDHPLVEDLKRKDFLASVELSEAQVCRPRFMAEFLAACRKLSPLVGFVSEALGLPYETGEASGAAVAFRLRA